MKPKILFTFTALLLLAMSTATTTAQNSENVRITPQLKAALQKYEISGHFSEGLCAVKAQNGYGFINTKGEIVIPCKLHYDEVRDFHEGLAAIGNGDYENRTWGFINIQGQLVISLNYDFVYNFNEGLAVVGNDKKYGAINKNGEVVIPYEYDYIGTFHDGLAVVGKNNKKGVINKKGELMIPCKYDFLGDFHDGLAPFAFYDSNKEGFINNKGEEKYLKYYRLEEFHEGLAGAWDINSEKRGFINTKGELVITCKYDQPGCYESYFSCGLAPVCYNDKYGFIDTKGKVVVPFKYDMAWNFYDGMALVSHNDKWGFINLKGEEVIPCKYEVNTDCDYSLTPDYFFYNGLAKVFIWTSSSAKDGFVDKYGNTTFSNSGNKKTSGAKKQRKTSRHR